MGSTWTYWTECLSIVKLFDIIKCNSSCILCSFMLFNIHGLRPPLISPWKWRGCSDYPYCLIVPSFHQAVQHCPSQLTQANWLWWGWVQGSWVQGSSQWWAGGLVSEGLYISLPSYVNFESVWPLVCKRSLNCNFILHKTTWFVEFFRDVWYFMFWKIYSAEDWGQKKLYVAKL